MKILVSTISEIAKTSDLNSLIDQLNIPFFGNYNSYFFDKNLSSILGHLMLQRLLSEANLDKSVLQSLHLGPFGKLQVHAADIDFNISHSADKVIAAFSDQGAIGVDIEKIRSFEWHGYSDLFSLAEWDIICTSANREKIFFEFWTKKESLLKAYGLGLQVPMNQAITNDHTGKIENTAMAGYFTEVQISGYSCYVCTQHEVSDILVENFIINIQK